MPDLDTSWDALINPGAASDHFEPGLLPPFELHGAYADGDAWWLAELCRLVYRGAEPDDGPGRAEILARVEGRELQVFEHVGTHAALVALPALGERTIHALVFRGTSHLRDWLFNLNTIPTAWPGGGVVHRGFARALDQVWAPIEAVLSDLDGRIAYAGHSLGGAMATLAAARRRPATLYTFGSPRVGDARFGAKLQGVAAHRLVNGRDLVSQVPPPLGPRPFRHVGEARRLGPDVKPASADEAAHVVAGLSPERRWFDPHPALADHAPVNYVARLQERLGLG